MHLRIIRARIQPGRLDEFAKRWEEFAGANLKSIPGFRHGYFAGNRETHRVTGVTVWETPPDPARAQQVMQQMAERAQDLLAGPPEPEDYEILVEV